MQRPQPETVTLDDILITEELSQRSPRPPNLQAENQALHTLARQLVNQPETMLQSLVDMAIDLWFAGTVGVSLLETTPNGEEIFRWKVLAGALAQYVGGTTPRNFSPCATCLDRGTPQLFSHPERYFTYFQAAKTPIVEGLVLPLIADNHALGSIWIMSHDLSRHFDAEDVRVMTSLADFTAAALLLNQRQTQELLAKNAQLEAEVVERRRAEESSRESERRLQESTGMLERAQRVGGMGHWTYDVATQELFWSREARRIFVGECEFELSYEAAANLVHPEDLPNLVAATDEAFASSCPLEVEYRIIRPDGSERTVYLGADLDFDAAGQPVKMFGIVQDITDRKRAEEQLRESEERQAYLLKLNDAISPLIDSVEIQGVAARLLAEQLNTVRAFYTEISDDERYGVIHRDYVRGDTPNLSGTHNLADFGASLEITRSGPIVISDTQTSPLLPESERAAYAAANVIALIFIALFKGGKRVAHFSANQPTPRTWSSFEVSLLQETAERTWAAVERARAEAALRESEQRLSVIFAQAAVGLSEISLDGHFQQANDTLCRLLGRSRQELLGASVPEVTHPDDVPSSIKALGQVIETGEPVSLDKRYLRSDGTILWANIILTRLDDEQGQPRHVLAVTVDLSDRKQAEAERLQRIQEQAAREEEHQRAEALAELDRAKTVFFSNISHEFRTPLTLLLAPLQDALSDCATAQPSDRTHPLAPPQRERLELAHRNAIRLLKLVNTLLDFSRIEAGRMEAVYEPTDLAMFTTELASVFRSAIERAGLRLIVDCPPLPEPVYVDREMWEKIVLNLLSNAFKFTLEGEIAVRLHLADGDARERSGGGDRVMLQIQDTGTGIPPEELPHVFERFYQVRRAQARTHEGSGIGLALVHELIRLHGGTVDVSSTLGQGTCFTITIPLGKAHLPSDRLRRVVGDSPTETLSAKRTLRERERITATRTQASTAVGAAPYVEEAERWLPAEGNGEQGTGNREELSTPSDSDPPQPPLKRGENLLKVPLEVSTPSDSDPPQPPLKRGENLLKVPRDTQSAASSGFPLKKGDGRGISLGDLGGSPGLKTVPTPSPTRVLLVDDNADMRDYLTRILSEHVQVEAVADGASALAAAQERVPDLVLTDVMMPGLDGFELLKALRANPLTREVPIILLSARAGEESVVEGLEAGADDYLIKPFSAGQLVSRVKGHLQMAQLRLEALHQERTINRRKDELLSTVSHELNTPLVAILGWTRLLRANPSNQSMLIKSLETIERNATLQAKLIQDLLDITRISAGKLRLSLEPVELESVIEMAIASISHLAQAKKIDLVWWGVTGQKSKTLAPSNVDRVLVQGDRDRLQQIITNLLTNAIKFTPDKGSINVELSVIERQNSSDASIAEISITDTGIGISAEFLPHVFDRFRQAQESSSSKGLGLGLAIARHLVELHNGTIHAESAGVGQGATFVVTLPLKPVKS